MSVGRSSASGGRGELISDDSSDDVHQLDSCRRDLLRATTQLSAVKDECESLERRLIRTEQLQRTAVQEIENLEDNNRRLRREAEELKRDRTTLSAAQSELSSERDGLQVSLTAAHHRVRELEDALKARLDQQQAAEAVHNNLEEQRDVAVRHNANLTEQRRKLEEDLRRTADQFEEQQRVLEAWKQSIVREVDAMSSVVERSLARGAADVSTHNSSHSNGGVHDDLSLVSLIGVDHSTSGQSRHVDVKPLFTNMYQALKSLHQFLGALRKERREHEDYTNDIRQNCTAAERDVQALQAENRQLSQRTTQAEVHITRLVSQLEAATRQAQDATQQHALLIHGVGDALCAPSMDGPSLETQVRLVVAERNQLSDRCQHQQKLISDLKDEIVDVRRTTENRMALLEETTKQQARHEVAVYEERAVAALQDKRHALVEAASQREQWEQQEQGMRAEIDELLHQLKEAIGQRDAMQPLARQVPHLEEQISARDKQLGELRADYHTLRQEHQALRADHQQSIQQCRMECEMLKRHLGPYECSLAMLPSSGAASAQRAAPPPPQQPAFCSLFDLLIISLRVLHGARCDLGEMSWQRRALSNVVHEYHRMFGSLPQQYVTSRPLRCLLRFRRAVVAVLAANRLGRLVHGRHTAGREAFWSLRRGFGRVRLTPDTSVAVSGGCFGLHHPSVARFASLRQDDRTIRPQELILPSSAEASDVPALMATLMEQIRVGSPPPSSAWSRVAPTLAVSLQGGLQRLYLHYGRPMPTRGNYDRGHNSSASFASPSRGPSLVYPAGMLEAQIASPPSSRRSADHSTLSAMIGGRAPPGSAYRSGASDAAAFMLPPHFDQPAHPYATTPYRGGPDQHSVMSSYTPAASFLPSAPPPPNGSDEFSFEVLNVIRALDNKVAGALRLHHGAPLAPHRTPKSALKKR